MTPLIPLAALLLALSAPSAPVLQPVDGDAVAGIVNSWRTDRQPVRYDDAIAAEALAWAQHMAETDDVRHAPRHILLAMPDTTRAGECIAYGQPAWIDAVVAWLNSPPHLEVMRLPEYTRVGMGGVCNEYGCYWVLRLAN